MGTLVFNFEDLDGDNAAQALSRYFQGAGEQVVQTTVDPQIRTSSDIVYKTIDITFADGQKLTLLVKESGDIFSVLLNGKALPLKAQDDQEAAMAEMVKAMDDGRAAFQEALTKTQAVVPTTIRMAAPKVESVLKARLASLNEEIDLAKKELESDA
ncbi:hypothetical protein [Paraburkholderia domus]|uniref:defense against restriction DarA-related protein n=1 Tax=Paraburkholderia domus TaxID=2793075 RepID=UPI001913E93C|nr:hypothetical protein [Paraburkholderia domus]MBK5061821.1 hypothetical protein [Burkholderia sp. R-70199]CAE6901156.1 hypothetical protein R70199_03701 [Paraburkholderia domus]